MRMHLLDVFLNRSRDAAANPANLAYVDINQGGQVQDTIYMVTVPLLHLLHVHDCTVLATEIQPLSGALTSQRPHTG